MVLYDYMSIDQGRRRRILIIDDQSDLADLYKRRLIREGFDVEQAEGGDVGIEKARTFKPDLLLLDLMMPGLSGFDTISRFRKIVETNACIIMILSALSGPEDVEKAKELGADDYIVKSDTTIEGLTERVKQALGVTMAASKSMGAQE
jgi:DNA-binding response OmpR family regulator